MSLRSWLSEPITLDYIQRSHAHSHATRWKWYAWGRMGNEENCNQYCGLRSTPTSAKDLNRRLQRVHSFTRPEAERLMQGRERPRLPFWVNCMRLSRLQRWAEKASNHHPHLTTTMITSTAQCKCPLAKRDNRNLAARRRTFLNSSILGKARNTNIS